MQKTIYRIICLYAFQTHAEANNILFSYRNVYAIYHEKQGYIEWNYIRATFEKERNWNSKVIILFYFFLVLVWFFERESESASGGGGTEGEGEREF